MNLHSEEINEIATALSKAQGEFRAAQKDGANPHFRSKFSTLHSHWEACRSVLSKNGLAVTQLANVLEDGRDVLYTILSHSSGQWFKSSMILKPVKNDPQGMGSCLTYARRYMLSAIVGTTSDDDDDDGEAATGRVKAPAQPKPEPLRITGTQAHVLHGLRVQIPKDAQEGLDAWLLKMFNCDLSNLPVDQFDKILKILNDKIKFHEDEKN